MPGIYSAGQRRMPAIADSASGCKPMIFTCGFCAFKYLATPVMVPVVPMALTKWVILPSVCAQISGPVVR